MTDGTSQGLFIVVAIVIFGIFVVLAYILFEDTLSPAMASMFTTATEKYTVSSEEIHKEGYYEFEYIKNATESRILNYFGHEQGELDVIIPETLGGVPVTSIAQNSFNKRGLTSVALPKTLERIEDGTHLDFHNSTGAFANNEIMAITIPGNMVYVGSDSFSGNPLTNGVSFDEGKPVDLRSYSFWNTGLTSITIPKRVKNLVNPIFEDSKKLKSFSFEGNRTGTFGSFLFQDTGLEGIVKIPEGFTFIGKMAVSSTNITELHIPSTAITLQEDIVLHNHLLERIYLPEHLREQVDKNPKIFRRNTDLSNPIELIYFN